MLPRFSRYGGVEQFAYRLAETLAARGHAVDFICARQEIDPPEGVRVLRTGRPYGPRWLKMLVFARGAESLRRKGGYNCVISLGKTFTQDIMRVGGGPLQAFWRLSRQAWAPGFPRLWKQFTRRLDPANWLTIAIEKKMYTQTPCIVAISDAVRGWVEEVYPHLAAQEGAPIAQPGAQTHTQTLRTIYNCPDTSRFAPPTAEERRAARRRLVSREDAYIVGTASTNFALKGVGQLIEALSLLPEEAHLCIAGGRKPDRYQAMAEKLGLGDRVHFCGKVSDMQGFYHGLDLFILPTFYDTLGNVVLEALACGLDVICSDRAGAVAFLPENRVLRHPESPRAIADSILAARSGAAPGPLPPSPGTGINEFVALVEETLQKGRP